MARSDWYYAYQHIHTFCNDPFTSLQPEMLFQVSRFLINSMRQAESPPGVSRVNILYTLAKQANVLGAYKLARVTYTNLQQLKVPESWEDSIDLDMLLIQAKPVRDNPELLPVCYRCGSTNPLLNRYDNKQMTMGDRCTVCGHPFVRSFLNFDVLPLVEFFPNEDISDEDAVEAIRKKKGSVGGKKNGSGWSEGKRGESNVMNLGGGGGDGGDDEDGGDLFNRAVNLTLESQDGAQAYSPVALDLATLNSLTREEVYVCKPMVKGMRMSFFKNMIPDIAVAISQPCHRFFNEEDFEFVYLKNGACPVSRVNDVGDYGPL
jgi:intraflagellar transport protein 122